MFRLPLNIRTKLLLSFPLKSYIPLCFARNIYPTPSLFWSGVLLLRIQVWSAVLLGIRRLQNRLVVGGCVHRCVVSQISIGLKIYCIGNGGIAGEFMCVSQIIYQVIIHLHRLTEKIGNPLSSSTFNREMYGCLASKMRGCFEGDDGILLPHWRWRW
jgi:hypothetical protein